MVEWKKQIFVNAIKVRVNAGEGTKEEIVATYSKLTAKEKKEILQNLT